MRALRDERARLGEPPGCDERARLGEPPGCLLQGGAGRTWVPRWPAAPADWAPAPHQQRRPRAWHRVDWRRCARQLPRPRHIPPRQRPRRASGLGAAGCTDAATRPTQPPPPEPTRSGAREPRSSARSSAAEWHRGPRPRSHPACNRRPTDPGEASARGRPPRAGNPPGPHRAGNLARRPRPATRTVRKARVLRAGQANPGAAGRRCSSAQRPPALCPALRSPQRSSPLRRYVLPQRYYTTS